MVYSPLLLLVFIGIALSTPDVNRSDAGFLWKLYKTNVRMEDENFYEFFNRITHGEIYNISVINHDMLEKMGFHYPPIKKSDIPEFNCIVNKQKPHVKATSVHRLTPYDVDIVAAMGDSLTAGFGACAYTLIDLFVECRGISWSIGGDGDISKHTTLPNILKEYNSKLTGYAVGIDPPLIPFPNENLDVAVSGATSYGMLKQAKRLVKTMLIDPRYDYFGSWKVLTLFVGGNDLCSCCRPWRGYDVTYSPENYLKEITKTLNYLHERVPKMFVNLINAPDVTILNDLRSLYCDLPHFIECKCGTIWGANARNYTYYASQKYHQLLAKLVESKSYDTRDDFTVVLQPFFDETIIPRLPNGDVDKTYFAPDCFHFSRKAHAASALALWNSMLEPVGNKSREWHTGEHYRCPTEEKPYFYTRKNSYQKFTGENADDASERTLSSTNKGIFYRIRASVMSFHTIFDGKSIAVQRDCGEEEIVVGFDSMNFFCAAGFFVLLCVIFLWIPRFSMIKIKK